MPFLTLSDVELHYEIVGTGQPLVLLSGLGGTIQSWAYQQADFAKHYQLIMIDNRGAGQSRLLTDTPFDLKAMADDVKKLLDHLMISKAHVLGFSMGGRIAQHMALNYPERIERLVLGATAAYKSARAHFIFQHFIDMLDQDIPSSLKQKWLLPWLYSSRVFDDADGLARIMTDRPAKSRVPKASYQAQFDAIYQQDRYVNVSAIPCPTLLIVGEEDLLTPPEMTAYIHRKIAQSQCVTIPGGHNIHVESAKQFNETVLGFLAATS